MTKLGTAVLLAAILFMSPMRALWAQAGQTAPTTTPARPETELSGTGLLFGVPDSRLKDEVAVAFSAFAQQPAHQKALPLKKRIPPANPAKYPPVREQIAGAQPWQNPTLVVTLDGIVVRIRDFSPITIPSAQTMLVKDVVGFLNMLPNQAWPYGLIVEVGETGVFPEGEGYKLADQYSQLRDRLRKAGIPVYQGVTMTTE